MSTTPHRLLFRLFPWLFPWLLALLTQGAAAQGVPGVRVEYFNFGGTPPASIPGTGAVVDRVESNISVIRSTSAPAPGVGSDNYQARYSGSILVPTTGAYTFQVEADDGVRLYVDCNNSGTFQSTELLIDRWIEQSTATYQASCPSNLTAGTYYRFRVDYYERGGEQSMRLSWAGPAPVGNTQTVIPRGSATQGLYSGVVDNTPPTISSAQLACGATNQILVTFSETIDVASAQTLSNYSLSGGHSITSAVVTGDGTAVALTLTPSLTTNRTLTVNNVRDLAANSIAANSTAAVPYAPTAIASGLVGNYFGQNGTQRAYFGGNSVQRIDSTVDFDWGSGTAGVSGVGADDFSVRWTGLIRIPTTGTYSLRTSSDDGVRLYINGSLVIDNWTDHGPTLDTSSGIAFTAGSYIPVTLEFFERGGGATIRLQWSTPGSGGAFAAIPASQLFHCVPAAVASFTISGTGAGSTCVPQVLTITARDANGATLTSYAGTVNLTSSTGRGDWLTGTAVAPRGNLTPGAVNSGNATYQFSAADSGSVQLRLSHSLAQSPTVTVVDNNVSSTSTTSAPIVFRDNALVWAEDLSNRIAGSNIVVAGRPHDLQVSLIKKDPSSGSCGTATDFNGTRSMKIWRTDSGGAWAAPSVVAPALVMPAARPASNNLNLSFTAGVATLNLATTDIGKYTLNLDDDSLAYAGTTVSGGIGDLVVRPFAIVVSGLTLSGTGNPGVGNPNDAVFGKAGAPFSATVAAYRWAVGADGGGDGVPDASATLAQVTAAGRTASFNATVALTPLSGSQTPTISSGGVLGSLSNNIVSGFSGGTVTVANLAYSEVGSFQLNTSAVVGNFLGSGLALDATVFNAAGAQQNRVGRFIPAGFVASAFAATHRSALACTPASTFTYLGEDMRLAFTLTARNAVGATTLNYFDAFAKLSFTAPSALNLAGISGTTMFKPTARLSTSASTGDWGRATNTPPANTTPGTAQVTLTANALRGASPEGPLAPSFGIAPVDSDGVGMLSLDLDTDVPANVADRALLGQIPLRYGRLRLQNAMSAASRTLRLPLMAQYWDGSSSTFKINDLDSCTRVTAANLSFGNFRKQLAAADAVMSPNAVTVNPTGSSFITLQAPSGSRVGSLDVAIALGTGAAPADDSCMPTGWRTTAAATGANLIALRGPWCAGNSDPSARATWGLYRGADGIVFQRENY
ncbi:MULTISPECIES: DUF6701 domain-containing protein [unclassified Roseateles]|uniref:DUF6701 domain-containing protein n=1 Tax=unclassified Roseateles TaxID=2626991 RepID=UPI0006F80FF0|nr:MULTISPECIES: DUF6701 domain-containing protein [unclassified Roseateles]KQW43565.1 hypothetical protein ASC81_17525 [Pelomonas sp. Root405]KRA71303.1 hypothetical protein ASD88_16045 [Pelomonas sp. Root662]